METTIRRNSKKANEIFDKATNIKSYTLENCFRGKQCEKIGYDGQNWLKKDWERFSFAKLTTDKQGHYCLHIHSNCWAEFASIK
ncbi:MAG: hypothetical protein ABIJ26_07775 [Candidatus Margulisiibacteriota bacterium]|uniref:Uncharacterized protein n=1 Tax=viral metagenome TaxID=1070528 RepID=A0A6H1Z9L6_9ZZZZ